MASRVSFRPRPLDVNKPLCIVKDLAELDSSDALVSRDVTHNHEALDKDNEEALMVKTNKNKKGREIPIPSVRKVATYERDYLPLFRRTSGYIRGKGGTGYTDKDFVEYDLDKEDEEFLEELNRGQPRLSDTKFERMLWKLELACAEATEKTLRAAGASVAERKSVAAAASCDYLGESQALDTLKNDGGGPEGTLKKVLSYWVKKRSRRQKPLLRKLQAPTPPGDGNPFNVFRPREKIHRPQTRRRRENNSEAFEKMEVIKQNMENAMDVLWSVIERETKKRSRTGIEVMMRKTELQSRFAPHLDPAQIALANRQEYEKRQAQWEEEGKQWAKRQRSMFNEVMKLRKQGLKKDLGNRQNGVDESKKKDKKRKREAAPVAQLPHPPLKHDEESLFCEPPPTLEEAFDGNTEAIVGVGVDSVKRARVRFGRGGRFVFDRIDPLTQTPLGTETVEPDDTSLPLQMPDLLKKLITIDKQEEQRKNQQNQAKSGTRPPAKQTPGLLKDRHGNQQAGTSRVGPSTQLPVSNNDTAANRANQLAALQRKVHGRPPKPKSSRNNNGGYQSNHQFQVEAMVANGRSAQRS